MKNIILLLVTFFLTNQVFSQTGPGGVGTRDGSSSLEIWLLANDLNADEDFMNNPSNGSLVSAWLDYSGNSNDFSQTGTSRPTYNSIGTFNAVNFNASLATAQFMNGSIAGSYIDASAYFVTNPVNNSASHTLFDNGSHSLRSEQWNNSLNVGFTRYGVADYASTISSPFGVNSIFSFHKTGGAASVDIRVNNLLDNVAIGSSAAGIPYDRIGKNSGNDRATGDFYEVLLFSSRLNTAQIVIVDNYLSAKYASIAIANDLYNQDDVGNGNYDHDVAGIGRIDASNLHTDAQGTGIVRILNPVGLGDDEFFIWGHDNNLQQASETTDVPVPVVARFARVWRVSEVNTAGTAIDVGAIDIRFDLTGLGTVTTSDLRLLVDTDNDGVFTDETTISGATNVSGNIYQFAGVTAIANNLRFTLGTINISQTPLPIELLNFSATAINNDHVRLNWQTASEINNEYFTVEHSENGFDWEELILVAGAGNSSSLLSYSATDKRPYLGVSYYRLKQTDFDGKFKHSEIRSVDVKAENDIRIFPNPATNQITITGKEIGFEEITIYNTLGQNVTNLTPKSIENGGVVIVDLSKLSSGIYYVKTKTTTKLYKQ